MRTPTKYLKELRTALKQAEVLVSEVRQTIPMSKKDTLRVRSYVLITHAAMEEYIEKLTLEVALEARSRLKKKELFPLP